MLGRDNHNPARPGKGQAEDFGSDRVVGGPVTSNALSTSREISQGLADCQNGKMGRF
jgi:hypothetical protein